MYYRIKKNRLQHSCSDMNISWINPKKKGIFVIVRHQRSRTWMNGRKRMRGEERNTRDFFPLQNIAIH